MKTLFLFILLAFSFSSGYSQLIAHGYYVPLTGDSVPATFKIPERKLDVNDRWEDRHRNHIDFFEIKEGIEIVDSLGHSRFLTPTEVKGFVFRIDTAVYKLFSKPVSEYRRNFFLPEFMGRKIRLLYYTTYVPGTPPLGVNAHAASGHEMFAYALEKYNRTYLFIDYNMKHKEKVKKLKDFFSDKPEIQKLIDEKLADRILPNWGKTLRSIVEMYDAS